MKKLLVSLLLMLPLCGFAQKGMQGIGGGLNVGVCWDDADCAFAGGSIKYQNHLTDRVRAVASFEYIYAEEYHQWGEAYDVGCSLNFFFNDVARLRPYAIWGFFIGEYIYNYDYYIRGSIFFGGMNYGIGLDYRLSYHCSLQAEMLGLISSFSDVFFFGPNISLTYTF